MRRSRLRVVVWVSALGAALFSLACASDATVSKGAAGSSGRAMDGGAGAQGGQHSASAAASGGSGNAAQGGQSASDRCADSKLTWRTANKTNYTSYPEPGSAECIEFSGCEYQGQFAACDDTKSETWVSKHNIVAIFPDLRSHKLHDLCLRKPDGTKTLIVTVYDTCSDSDCDGCCTQNQGSAEALIDVEHYTDERWGVSDGPIQWADLGPTVADGCNGK